MPGGPATAFTPSTTLQGGAPYVGYNAAGQPTSVTDGDGNTTSSATTPKASSPGSRTPRAP